MEANEFEQVLRARDRRRSKNAVMVVLGLAAFFGLLVVLRGISESSANRPVQVRTIEDMKAAR